MHSNADTLLAQHPDIETVEALITDCNGAARGKWLPIEKLPTLLTDGIKLPKSAVAQDAWGRDVPRIALDNGDLDGWCQAVPDSLVPVLTGTGGDRAHVVLTKHRPQNVNHQSSTLKRECAECFVTRPLHYHFHSDQRQTRLRTAAGGCARSHLASPAPYRQFPVSARTSPLACPPSLPPLRSQMLYTPAATRAGAAATSAVLDQASPGELPFAPLTLRLQ